MASQKLLPVQNQQYMLEKGVKYVKWYQCGKWSRPGTFAVNFEYI